MTSRKSVAGATVAPPACEQHAPLTEWSRKDLALGRCPACGQPAGDDPKVARELRARESIENEIVFAAIVSRARLW